MAITLHQFEQIDSLMADLLRMGPFETCADPRGYIRATNILHDTLIDVFGYDAGDIYACTLDWAADVVAQALLGQIEVLDGETV